MLTKITALTDHIAITQDLTQAITSSTCHSIPLFNSELTLFYKQAVLGTDLRSFQLLCYLDRTFVGYSYLQGYRNELRLTVNNILYFPGTYCWPQDATPFSFDRVNELNGLGHYALYVEPGFRRNVPGTHYSGFGALLLKSSLCIAQKNDPWLDRLTVHMVRHKLPFYEKNLNFKKRFLYFCLGEIVHSLSFQHTMESLDRTAVIKKYTTYHE